MMLKNNIWFLTIILMTICIMFEYHNRGYFAVGGEYAVLLIPFCYNVLSREYEKFGSWYGVVTGRYSK